MACMPGWAAAALALLSAPRAPAAPRIVPDPGSSRRSRCTALLAGAAWAPPRPNPHRAEPPIPSAGAQGEPEGRRCPVFWTRVLNTAQVYNESLRDLLAPQGGNQPATLGDLNAIRHDPSGERLLGML